MNANSIFKRTKRVLRNHGADIFSVLAGIGVIATGVSAYKAGNNKKYASDGNTSEGEREKLCNLLVPLSCGTATIGCIYAARKYGKIKEESLLAACSLLVSYSARQRGSGQDDVASGDSDDRGHSSTVKSNIEDTGTGDIIFIETFTGRRFKASLEVVEYALRKLQENFSICGYVSLNDFYSLLGIEETASGEILGWTTDQMVLDPDYKPGNFFEYREALTTLAIHLSKVDDNTYELHYNILPVGSLAGIGPCNY